MLIPSEVICPSSIGTSLSRRVNANSQLPAGLATAMAKLIKKGEC